MLVSIFAVRLDADGFDDQGMYHGHGRPVFYVLCANPKIDAYKRAKDICELKASLRQQYGRYKIHYL